MLFVILMFMVLLSVAFITLFERKLLGYMQLRKGPNKIFIKGMFQPMSDGLKLFMKEEMSGLVINKLMYMFFPVFYFMLMLMFWGLFNFYDFNVVMNTLMVFILISGLGVYSVMGGGWSSNSKYSLLGSYRSVAQTVSYEVGMVFALMGVVYFDKTFFLGAESEFVFMQGMKVFLMLFIMLIWLIIVLAELNRSPFDFAESESELVSGFNTEFGSGKFVFLFLAEYGNIIFMSYITMYFFFMASYCYNMIMVIVFIIWIRGVLPRLRYDNLMYMNWKIFLPVLMIFLVIVLKMEMIIYLK